MLPKVSILIPCYNADHWINQAIQSALDQTYPHKEVIVVDDGSSDRSLEIIKSFGDRILWETGENWGGNAARNRLLELSTGEWLQYLDADDYLLPEKIEQQVKYLAQVPNADIIYSPTIYEYWQKDNSRREVLPIPEPHDPWILLARWFLPQTGSPLWRKQALLEVGGWKPDQPCCQEHELYLRLLIAGKRFEYCFHAGAVYRQWSESTLCKKDKSKTQEQRLLIKDRLEEHLKKQGLLTAERQHSINQARFECARMIWSSNRGWAKQLAAKIQSTERHFIPSEAAAPKSYQIIYRLFGFAAAEQIAQLKRSLVY
ncbi:glycosyltransferase [Leptolyngbya sp. FACHB-711]|uniref:glycosyltransferase n=1 Tax=Leptolyngbya sp. FACHB-711 TaxID=2692813 RepID=UPI00168479C4|nr:glycosyltransferase [Leptolyngbya sp. FACHB-711]MBD2028214.1 glycosyltransferase [Leptolyngbya sp. FACHB-711]